LASLSSGAPVAHQSSVKSYTLTFSLLLASLAPCAEAQFNSHEKVSLSGQIEGAGGASGNLMVALSSRSSPEHRTDVNSSGTFEFHDLPSGQYELKVTNLYGDVIHQEFLALTSAANNVWVRLPGQEHEHARASSATVSAARLRHNVPSKARKEFELGMKAADGNDTAAAIGHLARATELDPEFMEAHNNLGVQHLKCDGEEPAAQEFQKAIELDPGAPSPQINLANVLIRMERFEEAEAAARTAVRLNGANANARHALGLALLRQRKYTSEALDSLRQASETVPRARLVLAEFLEKRGEIERARNELRAYLSSAAPSDRKWVQNWLDQLR